MLPDEIESLKKLQEMNVSEAVVPTSFAASTCNQVFNNKVIKIPAVLGELSSLRVSLHLPLDFDPTKFGRKSTSPTTS